MQTTTHPAEQGHRFTLTAETDADRALLDAIHWDGLHAAVLSGTHKTPEGAGWAVAGITLVIDRKHPQALEAQSARQLLRTFRELLRLSLGEHAVHSHVGLDAANPQTKHELAALLKQLQLMLEGGSAITVEQAETSGQKVDGTHGNLSSESAIVGHQQGAAA